MNIVTNKNLSGNAIKIIVAVLVLLSHMSYVGFISYGFYDMLARITPVVLAYILIEGFEKTRDVKKYILRLFIFAVISQPIYYLFSKCIGMRFSDLANMNLIKFITGYNFTYIFTDKPLIYKVFSYISYSDLNILFTLFCGLLCIYSVEKVKSNIYKLLILIFFVAISFPGEWGGYGVLGTYIIYKLPKEKRAVYGTLSFFILAVIVNFCSDVMFNIYYNHNDLLTLKALALNLFDWIGSYSFMLLSILVWRKYNGEKGKINLKYTFYMLYPFHMLIIFLLSLIRYQNSGF